MKLLCIWTTITISLKSLFKAENAEFTILEEGVGTSDLGDIIEDMDRYQLNKGCRATKRVSLPLYINNSVISFN